MVGNPAVKCLIPSMCCRQQWMPLVVMKQDQCSAAQDRTQASDQSSRNEYIAVDGLAMSIDIAGERTPFIVTLDFWMPEIRCPPRQGIGQAFGSASMGHLR